MLGKRYGKLPSQVLRDGDSFDLMVFDVAQTYEAYQNKKANKQDISDMLSKDELEAQMAQFKNRKK